MVELNNNCPMEKDLLEVQPNKTITTKSTSSSVVTSTKKIFRYSELLKVTKNTPKSQIKFITIYRRSSFDHFDTEKRSSIKSSSKMDLDCAEQLIANDDDNDNISNRPVISMVLEYNENSIDNHHNYDDHDDRSSDNYSIVDNHLVSTTTKSIQSGDDDDDDDPIILCNIDELVREGDYAISVGGVLPQRIHQGSSGSYFVKNIDHNVIAIFKPKNEEPYGRLNPKWLKWMHKTCLPCCFGRSCILPNQGYLSEVGASIVDSYLGTDIVPKTTIAWLSSPTFNYGRIDRSNLRAKRLLSKSMPNAVCKKIKCELPSKVGSYQEFVPNYMNSSVFITKINSSESFFSSKLGRIFLEKFQRMALLDYFIRNTDRGNDNWLIYMPNVELLDEQNHKFWGEEDKKNCEQQQKITDDHILLAAIDNGLAFPFKHPDSWRSYPFLWAWLPCAKIPFLDSFKSKFLPKLTSLDAIDDLVCRLRALFSIDKGFSEERFDDQMAVMKGQIYNICNAFRNNMSPYDMVKQNAIYIRSQEAWDTVSISDENFHKKHPLFSCI